MPVALTALNTKVFSDGNKKSVLYSLAFTGTYPSGGFTVNNATFPSAAQVFKRIDRLLWQGGCINENGYKFLCKQSEVDNSDDTNQSFKIRVFIPTTGGGGYTEITAGLAFAQTSYLVVEGVKVGGVVGDQV